MAFLGAGATIGANESGSNVNFTEVREIELPQFTSNNPETTHLTSACDWRTYTVGTKEGGLLKFRSLYNETDYLRLIALYNVSKTWRVQDSQSSSNVVWSIPGALNNVINPKFVQDGDAVVVEMGAEIKVLGPVTITS